MVIMGLRGSVHAAAKQARLGASVQALYEKIKRTEPVLMRALVQGSAQRLGPGVQPMGTEPVLPGRTEEECRVRQPQRGTVAGCLDLLHRHAGQ